MSTFTKTQSGHRFNEMYCSKANQAYWEAYFLNMERLCKVSTVSEMLDLNNYKRHRMAFKIAKVLRSENHKPFVFISCLN